VLAFTGRLSRARHGALTVDRPAIFFRSLHTAARRLRHVFSLPAPGARRFGRARKAFVRDAEALLARGEIGAILVEPVQGRGGEVVPPEWFPA